MLVSYGVRHSEKIIKIRKTFFFMYIEKFNLEKEESVHMFCLVLIDWKREISIQIYIKIIQSEQICIKKCHLSTRQRRVGGQPSRAECASRHKGVGDGPPPLPGGGEDGLEGAFVFHQQLPHGRGVGVFGGR